jgi:hypothetical protein
MISTKQEALEELRDMLQRNTVVLGWSEKPVTFEELIRARQGDEIIDEIYEVIDR